jgi:DNA-binding GntR family transcriptional regulator
MIEAKERFYDLLFEGADNDVIRSIMATLRVRATLMRATSLSQPGRPQQAIAEIEDIVSAIEARDGAAAEAACTHHVQQAARMALATSSGWPAEIGKNT